MKGNQARVLTGFVSNLVNYARAQGNSVESILRFTGINHSELIDRESRISDEVVPKLWRLISSSSGTSPCSIHMASAAPKTALGACENLVRYAPTMNEAINAVVRYSRLIADRIDVRRIETDETVALQAWHPLDAADGGHAGEFGLALFSRLFDECLDRKCVQTVEFANSPLGSAFVYEEYFGVKPRFSQEYNRLVFSKSILENPLSESNPQLFDYALFNVELLEDRWLIPGKRSAIARIYQAARTNAKNSQFSVNEIANSLGISVRRLQRQAEAYGLTLSQIVVEARQLRAKEVLEDQELSLEDVAEILGYSDARSFRRAFTRWTGQSPSAYRKSLGLNQ